MASRAATIFFFSYFSFGLVGKYCSIFEKKKLFFWKTKKKVPSRPFLTHPAAEPETEFFFSLALWTGHLVTGRGTTKLWGTSEVYPHKKGGGGMKKVVSMLRRGGGGHNHFWGSLIQELDVLAIR